MTTRRESWYREIECLEERRACVFSEARDVIDVHEKLGILTRIVMFFVDFLLVRTNLLNRSLSVIRSLRTHVYDLERELAAARVRIRELNEAPVHVSPIISVGSIPPAADELDDVFFVDEKDIVDDVSL